VLSDFVQNGEKTNTTISSHINLAIDKEYLGKEKIVFMLGIFCLFWYCFYKIKL